MKAKYGQTIFLLWAMGCGQPSKKHISYKRVILISNACQPVCAKNVQPKPFITIGEKIIGINEKAHVTEQNMGFGMPFYH